MLWAVHISDGVLAWPWLACGFALAVLLLSLAAYRLREDEIPRVALLTAAFFVSSLVHIRLGPTSVHLLLNGLVGVLLGYRAALAIFVGLLLQVVLIQHGGFTTLGVNTCVLTLPALVAWCVFRALNAVRCLKWPAVRSVMVASVTAACLAAGVFCVALLATLALSEGSSLFAPELDSAALLQAGAALLHPLTWAVIVPASVATAWAERRLENAPEFPLGLFVGMVTVLLTIGLDCAVLIAGGVGFGTTPPLILTVAHLPIAVIEGVVLGFAVGFLAKVKPEMLGLASLPRERGENDTPPAHAGGSPGAKTSSSPTSH